MTITAIDFHLNGSGEVTKEPETLNKIPGNRAVWVYLAWVIIFPLLYVLR
jgi:hypothetical protein